MAGLGLLKYPSEDVSPSLTAKYAQRRGWGRIEGLMTRIVEVELIATAAGAFSEGTSI